MSALYPFLVTSPSCTSWRRTLSCPHLSTHPWSPPPAVQAGEGRRCPHLSLPIPGHLTQLHKQEKDPELPHLSLPIPGHLPQLYKLEKVAKPASLPIPGLGCPDIPKSY